MDFGRGSRVVIREIPYNTNPIYWVFDGSDCIYRMELWGWPHIMTACTMYSGDSYRAQSGRIEYSTERTTFYLDDRAAVVLTAGGEWKRE